ncbi:hypothetical protein MY4824_010005 [Beauveria thailandica]
MAADANATPVLSVSDIEQRCRAFIRGKMGAMHMRLPIATSSPSSSESKHKTTSTVYRLGRRLHELRAKSIPKPTPPPEPKQEPARATPSLPAKPVENAADAKLHTQQNLAQKQSDTKQEPPSALKPLTNGFGLNTAKPAQPVAQPELVKPASNLAFPAPNTAQPKTQPFWAPSPGMSRRSIVTLMVRSGGPSFRQL